MDFTHILKANPFHDALGRFTTGDMATFVTIWRKAGTDPKYLPATAPLSYKNIGLVEGNTVRPVEYVHMDKSAKAYIDKLPKDQKQAVLAYTGSAFSPINDHLRGLTGPSKAVTDLTALLDKAIGGKTLGTDAQVYRGVSGTYGKKLMDLHAAGNLEGAIMNEPGFMSATVDQKMGASWGYDGVMLKINVPASQKALYVGGEYPDDTYSKYPHENELILPRGANMTVMSVDTSGTIAGPKMVVTVTLNPKA